MAGGYFLRISNPTAGTIGGVSANTTLVYSDGTYNFSLDHSEFRYTTATATTQASGSYNQKARINAANYIGSTGTWQSISGTNITAGLKVEVGHIDNDGYFVAYFSSGY